MLHSASIGGRIQTYLKSFSVGTKILATVAGLILLLGLVAGNERIVGDLFDAACAGWFKYIARVYPQVHLVWPTVFIAGGCLIALLVGSQLFLSWLYRHLNESRWKIRWTLSIASLVFLLLLAGMSMMGVVHQTGWLIASPYHLTERRADWNCSANMHMIGIAIAMYSQDNGGEYPPDLATLLMKVPDASREVFICPSSDDEAAPAATTQAAAESLRLPHHCSYIYLGKGLKDPVPDSQVILVEPPQNHAGDGMNVLYGDGHAEWVDRKQAAEIFEKCGLKDEPQASQKERE